MENRRTEDCTGRVEAKRVVDANEELRNALGQRGRTAVSAGRGQLCSIVVMYLRREDAGFEGDNLMLLLASNTDFR